MSCPRDFGTTWVGTRHPSVFHGATPRVWASVTWPGPSQRLPLLWTTGIRLLSTAMKGTAPLGQTRVTWAHEGQHWVACPPRVTSCHSMTASWPGSWQTSVDPVTSRSWLPHARGWGLWSGSPSSGPKSASVSRPSWLRTQRCEPSWRGWCGADLRARPLSRQSEPRVCAVSAFPACPGPRTAASLSSPATVLCWKGWSWADAVASLAVASWTWSTGAPGSPT